MEEGIKGCYYDACCDALCIEQGLYEIKIEHSNRCMGGRSDDYKIINTKDGSKVILVKKPETNIGDLVANGVKIVRRIEEPEMLKIIDYLSGSSTSLEGYLKSEKGNTRQVYIPDSMSDYD